MFGGERGPLAGRRLPELLLTTRLRSAGIWRTIISGSLEMTKNVLRNLVDDLKALAHPTRQRILGLLRGGELCVCQIAEALGLAFSTTSEHLSLLRKAGFVSERREGKWVFYSLTCEPAPRHLCDAVWSMLAEDPAVQTDEEKVARIRMATAAAACSAVARKRR